MNTSPRLLALSALLPLPELSDSNKRRVQHFNRTTDEQARFVSPLSLSSLFLSLRARNQRDW